MDAPILHILLMRKEIQNPIRSTSNTPLKENINYIEEKFLMQRKIFRQ